MIEKFTYSEEVILGLLYYSKYEKRLLHQKSGTFQDVINELNGVMTGANTRNLFLRLKKYDIFKPDNKNEGKYFVDKDKLLQLLSYHSPLFILHYNIVDDNSEILLDNLNIPSVLSVFPSRTNYEDLETQHVPHSSMDVRATPDG